MSTEIFIVIKGKVCYAIETGLIVLNLESGDFFGEEEVILNKKRKYYAVSTDDSILLIFPAKYFID